MATEVAASEATLGEVERFLEEVIGDLKPAAPSNRVGRPAVLPALCLWAGLVVGVARGFTSQASIWRLLSQFGLWAYPRVAISDEAVYRRLARATTDPLERLFAQITAIVRERVAPYQTRALAAFATEVVAIDETTLDPVARRLPSPRECPRRTRPDCRASWPGCSMCGRSVGARSSIIATPIRMRSLRHGH